MRDSAAYFLSEINQRCIVAALKCTLQLGLSSGQVINIGYEEQSLEFCPVLDCFKTFPECRRLVDTLTPACTSVWMKNLPGIVAVVLLLSTAVIFCTVLRHSAFGALLRKNFLVRRIKLFKSIALQLVETSILMLVAVAVLYLTESKTESKTYLGITIVYSKPDENRTQLFRLLLPFIGILLVIVFSYPVASIIMSFVMEKETRMKECMRINGMRDLEFTGSWYLTILVKSLPICIFSACLLHFGQIFSNSPVSEILLFFLSFIFEIIGFSQLLTVFFNASARLAAMINVMIAFLFCALCFKLDSQNNLKNGNLAMCFLPSLCLNFGAVNMLSSSVHISGLHVSNDQSPYPSPYSCSWTMVLYGALYSLLAWYLEYLVPQKYGVRRHWTFPGTWLRKMCSKKSLNNSSLQTECLRVFNLGKIYNVGKLPGGIL